MFAKKVNTKDSSIPLSLTSKRSRDTGPGSVKDPRNTVVETKLLSENSSARKEIVPPRWRRFQKLIALILRSLGLGLLNVLRRVIVRPWGRRVEEPTKVAFYRNRKIALLRSLIHVVPIGVALAEIILNWGGHYLGGNVHNISYYQFAAKAHELTIQASLAAILFAYTRHHLALGKGLPFGALFSGLNVSQLGYLWSTEFWGAATARSLTVWGRASFVATVVLTILLAAVAGPSSAILLIPTLNFWSAGNTFFWVNTTGDAMWPSSLDGSMVPAYCSSFDVETESNLCPASEWQAINTWLQLSSKSLPESYIEEFGSIPAVGGIPMTGKSTLRDLSIEVRSADGLPTGFDRNTFLATSPQSAIADALATTGNLYYLAVSDTVSNTLSGASGRDIVYTISDSNYQAYTSASCGRDVIYGPKDKTPVYFPIPPGSRDLSLLNGKTLNNSTFVFHRFGNIMEDWYISAMERPGISREELYGTPGALSDYRLRWVELPEDPFNASAIGAVVLLPRAYSNETQNILSCTLSAGWGTTLLNVSLHDSDSANSNVVQSTALLPDLKYNFKSGATSEEGVLISSIWPYFPQRKVTVTEDWAEYLNPALPSLNTTIFNTLMINNLGIAASADILARVILAASLANGLSRSGYLAEVEGIPRTAFSPDLNITTIDGNYWLSGKGDVFSLPANESDTWLKLRVWTDVQGYAYSTRGLAPKIAIAFLLTYCIFAMCHVFYAGISGISATCWDSIAEVTTLAVNSLPSEKLRNTCAGITESHVFRLPVRILVSRDTEGEGEHLEMVFGDVEEGQVGRNRIVTNRLYG